MKNVRKYIASLTAFGLLQATILSPVPARAERQQLTAQQLKDVVAVAIATAPEIADNPRIAKIDLAEQSDDAMSGIFRGWFGPTVVLPDRKTWVELTCSLHAGVWDCNQFRYQRILSLKGRGDLWIENEVTYDEGIELLRYLESRIVEAKPGEIDLTAQEYRDIGHIFSCGETVCVVTRSEYGVPVQFKVRRTRSNSKLADYELLPLEWR